MKVYIVINDLWDDAIEGVFLSEKSAEDYIENKKVNPPETFSISEHEVADAPI